MVNRGSVSAMDMTTTTHPPTNPVGVATTHLVGADDYNRARPFVFELLVKLATPHVKHYVSDLYHDAEWVRTTTPRDQSFWFTYVVRECGTNLYDHMDDPRWSFATVDYWQRSDAVAMYRVNVWHDRRGWHATVSTLFARGGVA